VARSLEVRISLVGRMIPYGMLVFVIPVASGNLVAIDLSYIEWSIVTLISLSC
jgi:hypothetical protein